MASNTRLLATAMFCVALGSAPAQGNHPAGQGYPIGLNPWEMTTFVDQADAYAASGAHSVRIDLRWQEIEPAPGQFTWTELEKVVDHAQKRNMDVLLTLRAISSWGTNTYDPANPSDNASFPLHPANWTDFVNRLATQFKGRNVSYEIENEPNAPNYWKDSLANYVQLLQITYQAIHLADPQARVLSAPLSSGPAFKPRPAARVKELNATRDEWQTAILKSHAFTVIGVHDYYYPDRAMNGWTFQSYLDHVRGLAAQNGCSQCTVWITEMGYVSDSGVIGNGPYHPPLIQQMCWAEGAFHQAAASKVERVYWLFLKDLKKSATFGPMGLMNDNGSPRPVAAAFAAFAGSSAAEPACPTNLRTPPPGGPPPGEHAHG